MGLLDGLLGTQGGGLLDFLRNNAMNQQFNGGLASDQAQYGQPPMQAMAQMPAQAVPQSSPQPAPQMLQDTPQAAPQVPSFGPQGEGAFTTGLRALGNPGGAINKIADAVQGFTTGQTATQRQQSDLFKAYVGAGLSPSQAYVAVLNPQLASNLMGGGKTDDIKEYEYARKETPGLTFDKFMLQKKANQGEYSLTPQYGTDKDGNTVLIQTGKSGEAIRTKLP